MKRAAVNSADRNATVADLEIMGMRLGIQCAQRLLRGYAADPTERDRSPDAVMALFDRIESEFVINQRRTNGLTDAGEFAYRKGVRRGRESQLRHPEAEIRIERI
ncbi:hypothetical protein GGD66_000832 [Bradyrhizobium sp. CIR48]|uniref:hypothetical protein n=1 Tax=Bradyrhizobium sp. CIR48 TaxID=2663840 RepID=UPI0016068320|nr:hypothetical protein [Bradyrhizobium sp. CIR48]MBB4422306.1 hypothetical protein [Bradyrhizobium sp. CIR48]